MVLQGWDQTEDESLTGHPNDQVDTSGNGCDGRSGSGRSDNRSEWSRSRMN